MPQHQGEVTAIPASHSRIHLSLQGRTRDVLTLHAEEALSSPWHATLTLRGTQDDDGSEWLGQPLTLTIENESGQYRLAGEVFGVDRLRGTGATPSEAAAPTLRLHVGSTLLRLASSVDWRVFLGLNTEQLVRTVCMTHGISDSALSFHLAQADSCLPYVVQAGETDLAFVQRRLARAGMFFYSRADDKGHEVLVVTDDSAQCSYLPGGPVVYRPATSLHDKPETTDSNPPVFYRLSRQVSWQPQTQAIHDTRTEIAPEVHFDAEAQVQAPGRSYGRIVHESPGVPGIKEADKLARQCTQASAAQADRLAFAGTLVGLGAGTAFSLDANDFGSQASGDYLTVQVVHRADQRASRVGGQSDGSETPDHADDQHLVYTCEGTAIARTTPFRPTLPAFPDLPQTFTARIESNGPYARLDEQGRYRLRQLFDTQDTEHGESSIPLRRLSPYGGPPGAALATGIHTPLHDGDEVLLGCLNGDPDRPYVIGALPNTERASPVTSANKAQNRLRTAGDNELFMDDTVDAEAIALRTFAGQTILQLDAARTGHRIRLAATHGAMHLFAKQSQTLHAGTDLTERSGDSRTQIIEDAHSTTTQKAEIHHQAATDMQFAAHDNLNAHAGKNTELNAAKRMQVRAARDTKVTVHGSGGLIIQVQNGTVHAQCAKALRITGQGGGDIRFEQAGGGFMIDAGGNIQMWGAKVAINAPVAYQGPVDYQIGSAPAPAAANVGAATAPRPIANLVDPQAQDKPTQQDFEIVLTDEMLNQLNTHLTLTDHMAYRVISDLDDERKGQVSNGVIHVTGLKMKKTFSLELSEDIPS